ncbi:MAG: 3-deoxy-D-manno-octulosonic acid transferase [Gammaproteobacteria bacterium]|nr:3-deoxy-D-manno-octulosonic acid transferase [Gammaproteobacteria bacterium]MAY02809.1 3-deoxy-D-manno-octulosonic acid transferase [Gammaproteobacteria bacterium]|tara:strand:- start:66966 stop:68339 length:1374 start_codon:yes stop_codon:yes gene_type:complete
MLWFPATMAAADYISYHRQHGQGQSPFVICLAVNRSLYTLLYYLALPLIFLRLLWRSRKDQRYRRRWAERLGYYGKKNFATDQPAIVFHAVSVGELHAAVPLIKACMQTLPQWTFTLTATTVTGSARVRDIFSDAVQHCYLPNDTPGAVKRFLRAVKPRVLVIMETELWPNLIHYCKQEGCRVVLLNARLSEKSFLRYRKHARLTKTMLLNLFQLAAQFPEDAQRFRALGLPEQALQIAGTMKFDQQTDADQVAAGKTYRQALQRPVLVAGSTRQGEERKILEAYSGMLQDIPELLLLLVPRHPDRVEEVAALLKEAKLSFVRRSSAQMPEPETQVLLGDSMGEMQFYYACADLAFVGGSLVNTGGQNIIEPALVGVPVIYGPSRYNFQVVSDMLLEAGGLCLVRDEEELATLVIELLADQPRCQAMTEAATRVIAEQSGATARQLGLIQQATDSGQ